MKCFSTRRSRRRPLRVLVDGLDVAKRRELTKGISRKRPHREYLKARAAAAEAAKKNQSKLDNDDEEFVAPSDPGKLNLVADIFAMLDAVDTKGSHPLPEDVQTLLFALVDYANKLDLAGGITTMPKTHTTRTQEVYCGDVITNRGIVMFSDMVRIMAHLHGRPQTPCIFDLYPLVYMAWRTNDQRTTIAEHFVAAITVALPALVMKHGAAWANAAIRDHLFVPAAVKAVLVSHLLADMIRAGLADQALEALTEQPLADPSVNESAAIEAAVLLGHASLLARLRVDDRVQDTMAKWDKDAKKMRDERDAQKKAEAKRTDDEELDKRRAAAMPIVEAEVKRLQKLQLEKQLSELQQRLAVSEEQWQQRKDDWHKDNEEVGRYHQRRFDALSANLASAGIKRGHPSFDLFERHNEDITHGMWNKSRAQEIAASALESEERKAMHQLIDEVKQKLAAL